MNYNIFLSNLKRRLTTTSLFFCLSFCVLSCSSEPTPLSEKSSDKIAFEQLSTTLISLNSKYENLSNTQKRNSVKPHGKKFWRFFSRIFTSVVADVAGSISVNANGDVSVSIKQGIDTSIAVWKLWEPKAQNEANITTQQNTIGINTNAIPELHGNLVDDNAGYIHNAVIISMYENYGDELKELEESEMRAILNEEYEKVILNTNLSFSELHNDISDPTQVSRICAITQDCENVTDFISALKQEFKQCELELDILQLAMKEIMDNELGDDLPNYVNEVLDVVDDSSIPENSKSIIKSTIGVAGASSQLWISE